MEANRILQGDCIKLAADLEDESIAAVVCSPPYAQQRKKQYGGIDEQSYPDWTLKWMEAVKPKLKSSASVFIVIRPHIKSGQISDYVLRTRLKVREAGWIECEELIWYKPDAPPLGSIKRPRRAWEKILWFSTTSNPYCDLKACGNAESTRVGGFAGSDRFGGGNVVAKTQCRDLKRGTSRVTDIVTVPIGTMDKGIMHPAMYPQGVPDYLIQTFSREGDLIFDPFVGSGQTCLSCLRLKRKFIGVDMSEEYVNIAKMRIIEYQKRVDCTPP